MRVITGLSLFKQKPVAVKLHASIRSAAVNVTFSIAPKVRAYPFHCAVSKNHGHLLTCIGISCAAYIDFFFHWTCFTHGHVILPSLRHHYALLQIGAGYIIPGLPLLYHYTACKPVYHKKNIHINECQVFKWMASRNTCSTLHISSQLFC